MVARGGRAGRRRRRLLARRAGRTSRPVGLFPRRDGAGRRAGRIEPRGGEPALAGLDGRLPPERDLRVRWKGDVAGLRERDADRSLRGAHRAVPRERPAAAPAPGAGAALTLLACAAAAVLQAAAQGRAAVPRFAATAEVVKVTVAVSDARGGPVDGLGRRDFEVYADGRRQEIAFFAAPAEAPSMDVALALDTSGSMARWQEAAMSAAVRFLDEVPRAQLRLLVSFDTDVRFWKVGARVDHLVSEISRFARVGGATALRSALAAILERFGGGDRAALIVLTDGEDYGSLVGPTELHGLIQSTNVTLYPVYFPGREVSQGRALLLGLAGETGGRMFEGLGHDPSEIFKSIAAELASQYVIGFVPAASRPGSYHRLEVKLRSGARVRHRAGYRVGAGPSILERKLAAIARE